VIYKIDAILFKCTTLSSLLNGQLSFDLHFNIPDYILLQCLILLKN